MKLDWGIIKFVCTSTPNTIMDSEEKVKVKVKVKGVVNIGTANERIQLRRLNILHMIFEV